MDLLCLLTKGALGCLDGYAPSYSGPQPDALLLSYRHMDPHVGIEPTPSAWKAEVLPLYECELLEQVTGIEPASQPWQGRIMTIILYLQYSNLKTSLPVGPNSRMGSLALCVTSNFETMRMLSRASLGHMHKLSHGPAEVREESYYGLGTRTTCESTINPKSKKGTTLNFNRPYMVRRVRQTNLLTDRCNSNRGR